MGRLFSAALAAVVGTASSLALAGELVYTPVNPAFGGNPLNGAYLLNQAQLQNRHEDPRAARAAAQPQTPLESFNQSLQRIILNRIAAAVTGSVVDVGGNLIPGTIETTDFIINIIDLGGGVMEVITTDKATGQSTSFQVGSLP